MKAKDKLLTLKQVADMLGVNKETLRRWDNNGTFPAVKINARGHRRYLQSSVNSYLKRYGI